MIRYITRSLMTSPMNMALCLSEAAFHKEMRRLKVARTLWPEFVIEGANATAHFFIQDEAQEIAIICLKHEDRPFIEVAGILVHEAVHIWQSIRECIRESEPSKEFEAYAIQNISYSLMSTYQQLTQKEST